jgi:hypothetical protein
VHRLSQKYTRANTRPFPSADETLRELVMTETRFRQAFLLLLVTAISAALVAMIRAFVATSLASAFTLGMPFADTSSVSWRGAGERR